MESLFTYNASRLGFAEAGRYAVVWRGSFEPSILG